MIKNLCKTILAKGGDIVPLVISVNQSTGTGLMNPSVYNDYGRLIMNLRHVNYTLWHCENGKVFNNRYGPLSYLNPENDIHLKTWNYFCTLNEDYTVKNSSEIDMVLNIPPVWEFHGLEDARLFRWDEKLYICGCRRDVKDNGESRMELSEIRFDGDKMIELSRVRIQPPKDVTSYCEKNWMPVLDTPYHFVKWTNPTEVVKVDPETGASETIHLGKEKLEDVGDFRGSSQVITVGDYRFCIIHEVNLWKNALNQKDGKYTHRFIVWDKDWKVVKVSDQFSFMDGEIEFCCGMTLHKGKIIITFGFQDNAAFAISADLKVFEDFIGVVFGENKDAKLLNFKNIVVINNKKYPDRKKGIIKTLEDNGVTDYNIVVSTDETDAKNKITGKHVLQLSEISRNVAASHLQVIKDWYINKTTPYLIVLEDDASLDTVKYWNFKWVDFMEHLPLGWECIQLHCIGDNNEVKFKKQSTREWSCMAYMITREYAKKLVDLHFNKDVVVLELPSPNTEVQPHIENIIYNSDNVYSISLFTENPKFDSTILDRKDLEKHNKIHIDSNSTIMNWWETTGKNTQLNELFR